MTESDLIAAIHGDSGEPKAAVKRTLDALARVVTSELAANGNVRLPSIGTLTTKQRDARVGRNPSTGERLNIPATQTVKFTATKALKTAINTPNDGE